MDARSHAPQVSSRAAPPPESSPLPTMNSGLGFSTQ
jgi:hypothetical protein